MTTAAYDLRRAQLLTALGISSSDKDNGELQWDLYNQGGAGAALPAKGGAVQLVASTEQSNSFTINDDNTPTTNWPNRWEWSFKPFGQAAKLVSWVNEYGELRCSPGKNNTVPFRAFSKINPGDQAHTGPLIEIQDDRVTRTTKFSVDADGVVMAQGAITRQVPGGPTLSTGYIVLSSVAAVPANTPAGTLIVRIP